MSELGVDQLNELKAKRKNKMTMGINPPPSNGCCECCGRNIKELKPFGKAGDPLVGDFNGAILVKTFRTMANPTGKDKERIDRLMDIYGLEAEGKVTPKEITELLKKEFPGKELESYNLLAQLSQTVSASWECRTCILLSDEEYSRKLHGSK